MKRLLVLSLRDWRDRRAGEVERYAHEVFSRIARHAHYVAWVVHGGLAGAKRTTRSKDEVVDGIHLLCLGHRILYRKMVKTLLTRLRDGKPSKTAFDAVIDCVNGSPLNAGDCTDAPVVPLVFRLSPKVRAVDTPPGPVIAATEKARCQLIAAGMPQSHIVFAPPASDCAGLCTDETALRGKLDGTALAQTESESWDKTASLVLATIENL